MANAEKRTVVPIINVNHNDNNSGLVIKVDLAGASKKSVDMEMGDKGFCVKTEGDN